MKSSGPSPSSLAYNALGRVFAASAIMALPGIAGSWADGRWDTGWLGTIGFIVGPPLGLAYLLFVFRKPPSATAEKPQASIDRDSNPHGE